MTIRSWQTTIALMELVKTVDDDEVSAGYGERVCHGWPKCPLVGVLVVRLSH
jgi:hypothetical protein